MSNFLIALLVGASFGTWVFSKQMRRTGNNTKTSVIVAGMSGLIALVITFTVAVTIDGAVSK